MLVQKVPVKSQDIEDIIASDLEPTIEEKYHSLIYNASEGWVWYLLDKASKVVSTRPIEVAMLQQQYGKPDRGHIGNGDQIGQFRHG